MTAASSSVVSWLVGWLVECMHQRAWMMMRSLPNLFVIRNKSLDSVLETLGIRHCDAIVAASPQSKTVSAHALTHTTNRYNVLVVCDFAFGFQLYRMRHHIPIIGRMELTGLVQDRRWNVVSTTPDLHLSLAMQSSGLGLVQSRQSAVHALVQVPIANDRNPMQRKRVLDVEQRLDGALQHTGVRNVEREAGILQRLHIQPNKTKRTGDISNRSMD
jgi:hypothetical protein